ncbi:MAG: Gti1/Pac2 family protein [Planctomycetes bacterium]|nr:Gti1/Pac2 family protein [Planctomycetota bacterium]
MPDTETPSSVFHLMAAAGVPFVIIGGHAVTFHGYVRTTEDADVIFQRTPDSEAALLSALQSIHACWISNERDPATGLERLIPVSPSYLRGEHLMMLTTDLGFLDLYDYVPGFPDTPVSEVFADCAEFEGLRFVSLRWLRKLKVAAGRHKDLDDLEHLPPC